MIFSNLLKLMLFFAFLMNSSCSWKTKKLEYEADKEDIAKKFELSDKQQDPKVLKEENKQEKQKEKTEVVQLEKKEKAPTKTPKNKKNDLIKKSQSTTQSTDYPKEFKEYDKKSSKFWNLFNPKFPEKEETVFKVYYLGMTVGKVSIRVLPKTKLYGKPVYHFYARAASAPFYKAIYDIDDYVETYVEAENFLPLKYTLVQRESGQSVDDLQLFDRKLKKTKFFYKRKKKGRDRDIRKEVFIPELFQDSFSVLFFVRSLPLEIGDHYSFPVITRAKLWLIDIDVVGREKIKVAGEVVSALRLKAITQYPGVLEKKGTTEFWFSDSPEHRFLKFKAKIKLGTVTGEMVSYSE